ncbi:DUF2155 domain-containing protein [Sinirhodobacter sp. WL0062]|uniref:DUF2155 domain-containing protein n=1 Tax=Rhodobacter flavimaris TaxID=2907145 RepID=A0ABS8YZ94_9RHOB|nr:DUF2155 domain-containing protein [Sinirhodobacter sp. WL0062]MCE5974843.1 DUF2155 domain-containing protein [Sinirhodobacter sp. WL0062]
MIRLAMLALVLGTGAAMAQDTPEGLTEAPGAILRGLDKVAGTSSDIILSGGQTAEFGSISVTLRECRYPAEDPSSNAYAYLVVNDKGAATPAFAGWMIADSPALSALDHQRYDVWVIRCKIE